MLDVLSFWVGGGAIVEAMLLLPVLLLVQTRAGAAGDVEWCMMGDGGWGWGMVDVYMHACKQSAVKQKCSPLAKTEIQRKKQDDEKRLAFNGCCVCSVFRR